MPLHIHFKNKRLKDIFIASLDKNPSVSQALGYDHNTLRGMRHDNIKYCKTFLFNIYVILELSLFRNNYNQLYLFPFGMTEIFWLTYLVKLQFTQVKLKIFEHILLFTFMTFNHFFCFTIECRKLTGEDCFDFTLGCSLINLKSIRPKPV